MALAHPRWTRLALKRLSTQPGHAVATSLASGWASEFSKVCDALDSVQQYSYCLVSDRLRSDFELLDPAVVQDEARVGLETVALAQHRFLRLFTAVVQRANYDPLSRGEADFALSTQLRVSLPVTVDWSQLQPGLMQHGGGEAYGASEQGSFETPPPSFADKLLVFKRGRGVDTQVGYFYSDKIDELVSRLLRGMKTLVLRVLSVAGQKLRGLVSRASPSPQPAAGTPPSMLAPGARVAPDLKDLRVGLGDLELNAREVLSTVELKDPTFDTVVLVHCEAESSSGYTWTAFAVVKYFAKSSGAVAEGITAARRVVFVAVELVKSWLEHRRARNQRAKEGIVRDDDWFDITSEDLEVLWLESSFKAEPAEVPPPPPSSWPAWGSGSLQSSYVHPLLVMFDSIQSPPPPPPSGRYPSKVHVCVKQLRTVPVSELLLSFPAMDMKMKALDIARLVVLASAGAGIVTQLPEHEVLSTGGMLALGSLAAVALRLYWRYQIARTYCEHRAGQVATSRAYSRDFSTVSAVLADVADVETRSLIAVYSGLCSQTHADEPPSVDGWLPPVPYDAVKQWCQELALDAVADTGRRPPKIKVYLGLEQLERLGLVRAVDGQHQALHPKESFRELETVWGKLLLDDVDPDPAAFATQ